MPTLLVALAAVSLAQADVSEVAKKVEPPPVEKAAVPNFPASPSQRRFEVATGASLGLRPNSGTFGGTAVLDISFRVVSFLRAEVVLGYGLFDAPFQLVTVIRAGVRAELPIEFPIRPYLFVAFAHNHETGVDDVAQHPVDSILGTSEFGVNHRTGIEFGVGASWDLIQFREAAVGLRLGLRLTGSVFAGKGPLGYGDLLTTLGTTF